MQKKVIRFDCNLDSSWIILRPAETSSNNEWCDHTILYMHIFKYAQLSCAKLFFSSLRWTEQTCVKNTYGCHIPSYSMAMYVVYEWLRQEVCAPQLFLSKMRHLNFSFFNWDKKKISTIKKLVIFFFTKMLTLWKISR